MCFCSVLFSRIQRSDRLVPNGRGRQQPPPPASNRQHPNRAPTGTDNGTDTRDPDGNRNAGHKNAGTGTARKPDDREHNHRTSTGEHRHHRGHRPGAREARGTTNRRAPTDTTTTPPAAQNRNHNHRNDGTGTPNRRQGSAAEDDDRQPTHHQRRAARNRHNQRAAADRDGKRNDNEPNAEADADNQDTDTTTHTENTSHNKDQQRPPATQPRGTPLSIALCCDVSSPFHLLSFPAETTPTTTDGLGVYAKRAEAWTAKAPLVGKFSALYW